MRVMVIPNTHSDAAALLTSVCRRLESAGAQVQTLARPQALPAAREITAQLQDCDAVVTIGGDGTIMHVAKAAAAADCPVLGINAGHLGFLAGLEKNELDALPALLTGAYAVEQRALLEVTVTRAGETVGRYVAMNEAVVSRGTRSQLVALWVTDRGSEVLSCRADGVIAATPTGSTAYSLSAGGPVVDPAVDCLLVTPVCPHTVTARAYVLPPQAELTIRAAASDGGQAFLTVDGEENAAFDADDTVTVRRAPMAARLIRLKNTTVSAILTEKMLGRREL